MSTAPEDLEPALIGTDLPAAVLWDLDGTLVDTEPLWMEAEHALAQRHGAVWTQEDALALVGNALTVSGRYIVDRMGLSITPEAVIEELMDHMVRHTHTRVAFRPGARELLAELRALGVPCALVTMSYRRLVEPILPLFPAGSFDAVVAGDEVREGKPHPEAYLRAAELLGVRADDCVAIEDSPSGASSAEAAGARVVVVPHHVSVPAGGRRVRVESLDGLGVEGLLSVARNVQAL